MIRIIRLIGSVLIVLVGFVLGILVNNALADMFIGNSEWIGAIAGTVGHLAVFLLALFLASKVEGKRIEDYGVSVRGKDWGYLAGGLVVGIGVFLLITSPLYLTGAYRLDSGNANIVPLITSFILFIAVGASEELLFRGFFQHQMLRFGPLIAMIGSAALFALLHGLNPNMTFLAVFNIFLAGCFFSALIYSTGSLFTAIGAHITWNWTQGAILGIPVSGTQEQGFFSTLIQSQNTIITGGNFGAEASISTTLFLLVLIVGLLLYAYKIKRMKKYTAVYQ
ncbi:TPA: CPBP family intramembrane metalloprotease [Enterococcus faecium]|nr:CPBP family intramembrane metalloprotease [Enterococcus faecium]HAZ1150323.1 CPBP family intramembrane metalloprotease [Enterococcus faecium]HBK5084078.1 CPBP family intramembrane metalloprotease [Enterococcus faecium]HBK5268866.1 CPBP family intramembrane metalloprotease [Enterococcus faecium]